MSEPNSPHQESREKTPEELKELVAGWEKTLDAIELELEQNNEPACDEEE